MEESNISTKTKPVIISGLATLAVVGSLLVGSVAFAADNKPTDSLAQTIASKFNLKQEDVSKVIEDHRSTKQTERLTQALKDGKITEEQKNKIVAKQAEMKTKHEAARNIEDETKRKEALNAIRTEMQQWAKDNGIDMRYIGPGGGHGRPGGPPPSDAPTN